MLKIDDAFKALIAEAVRESVRDLTGDPRPHQTWRERLWTCHPDVRLGVAETCEALGRTKAFLYRHTRNKTIPFKRLDGELVFRASDVRRFIQEREQAA
jgi:hypothetical protein